MTLTLAKESTIAAAFPRVRAGKVDTMTETSGLIYDDEAAVHFVQKTTRLEEATVRAVLRSRVRYELGLGILPREAADDETPEQIRATQADLFPASHMADGIVDATLEREYIMRDSDVAEPLIRAVLDADREYMRQRGAIDG